MSNIRLYAQMKPTEESLAQLQTLQGQLPKQTHGRLVASNSIHLTLIHFGKVDDVYTIISSATSLAYDRYRELLEEYVTATERLLPVGPIRLSPKGFARFGRRGGTLVIEYEPTDSLLQVHAGMYSALCAFLQSCGITDIYAFIASDDNFMHAPFLKPHITLYKGYEGELPKTVFSPVTLYAMPVVYRPL